MKQIDISTPKHPNTFAIVDNEDFDYLNQWKWYSIPKNNSLYVVRGSGPAKKRIRIYMHREILGFPDKLFVDHLNHNPLDNRRCNLRVCTNSQNMANQKIRSGNKTSKYKGVCWDKTLKKWKASPGYQGEQKTIGFYKTESEAGIAYNNFMKEKFGEFACLNNIGVFA